MADAIIALHVNRTAERELRVLQVLRFHGSNFHSGRRRVPDRSRGLREHGAQQVDEVVPVEAVAAVSPCRPRPCCARSGRSGCGHLRRAGSPTRTCTPRRRCWRSSSPCLRAGTASRAPAAARTRSAASPCFCRRSSFLRNASCAESSWRIQLGIHEAPTRSTPMRRSGCRCSTPSITSALQRLHHRQRDREVVDRLEVACRRRGSREPAASRSRSTRGSSRWRPRPRRAARSARRLRRAIAHSGSSSTWLGEWPGGQYWPIINAAAPRRSLRAELDRRRHEAERHDDDRQQPRVDRAPLEHGARCPRARVDRERRVAVRGRCATRAELVNVSNTSWLANPSRSSARGPVVSMNEPVAMKFLRSRICDSSSARYSGSACRTPCRYPRTGPRRPASTPTGSVLHRGVEVRVQPSPTPP